MIKNTRNPIQKLHAELQIAERWVKIYASCGETEAAFDAKLEVARIRLELDILSVRSTISFYRETASQFSLSRIANSL